MTPVRLAVLFQEMYKRLAPVCGFIPRQYGFRSLSGARELRPDLVIAVAKEVLEMMEDEERVRQGIADGIPLHQIEDALDQEENRKAQTRKEIGE